MTRKLLEWSDIRPTRLHAQGRSGVGYQIRREPEGGWALLRFADAGDPGTRMSHGTKADMKALAEAQEADALGPPPAQRITWTRLKPGHYWGVAPVGLAYRILKIGIAVGCAIWRLEQFPNEDSEDGTTLDEGSLQSLKRRAEQDATDAAKDHVELEDA